MRHVRRKHCGPVVEHRFTEGSLPSLAFKIDEVMLQVLAPHDVERWAAVLDAEAHDLAYKHASLLLIHPLLRGSDKLHNLWPHDGTQCGASHHILRPRGVSLPAESRAAAQGRSRRRGRVRIQVRGQSQGHEHHGVCHQGRVWNPGQQSSWGGGGRWEGGFLNTHTNVSTALPPTGIRLLRDPLLAI
jgi:hypothetical protein